jgi:hypothetical protein
VKRFSLRNPLVPLALFILLAGGLYIVSLPDEAEAPVDNTPKAAVVDHLYQMNQARAFPDNAAALLENEGFDVTIYRGAEVTVELYRDLPFYGYDIIIFSTHAGTMYFQGDDGAAPRAGTYLFTGETYSNRRYLGEQLDGKIQNGWMNDDLPLVFAVNADFIRDELKGDFNDTAIIMMGCSSYAADDLGEAFRSRGASLYTGWSATLSLDHTDAATIHLLENLLAQRLDIGDATDSTMTVIGRDPVYGARLKYMPASAEKLNLYELIAGKR